MTQRKEQSIETLRGIAIILMVAGHVIGGTAEQGMRVDDDSTWRYSYYSLRFLRMPLFTVISGFVYSLRPVIRGIEGEFLRGKARRILLPLLTVASLQFTMKLVTPGVNKAEQASEIWRIWIFPYAQFWFLQAIFLIFITIAVVDRYDLMKTPQRWAGTLVAAVALSLFTPRFSQVFGFFGYLYLVPYFVLGCGLCRFADQLRKTNVVIPSAVVFLAAVAVQQSAWPGYGLLELPKSQEDPASALAMCVGLTGCLLLFRFRRAVPWLARLGFYSYAIYLFHVFGTAGARIGLRRIGLGSTWSVFIFGMAAGLGLPIVARFVIGRSRWLSFLLLGLRPRPKVEPARPP